MNGSALYSDIVLPAATWYEKNDISSTDLHPFVHSFNEAVPPPWEARTDWDVFNKIAEQFQRLAKTHLGVRRDLVAAPLLHDTPEELAQPGGVVRDWKRGECEPVPGRTMPKLVVVERDYGAVHDKMTALGPLVESAGIAWKGITWKPEQEVEELRHRNGVVRGGIADGRPQLTRDVHVAETIFRLSGTTNGRLAVEGFQMLEQRTGTKLADLAEDREDERITLEQVRVQPRKVITSPEWSGIESRTRRYSPFTVNVDRDVPWRTLTGRQHFYLDHDWMLEFGEGLPAYRPPLAVARHEQGVLEPGAAEVLVKWITPHSKWSIHSEFQDNLRMLELFRGGPVVWLAPADAEHDRRGRQRLGRDRQPQRRDRLPRGRLAPHPGRQRVHVPLAGPSRERADQRDLRSPRRHRQLRHADHDQADAPDRRLRAAVATASTTTARSAPSATSSPIVRAAAAR